MSSATVVVVDSEALVDATVVVGVMVVVVEADVVEAMLDVVVGGVVDVVVARGVVAPMDETSVDETAVACPVVEQATISSRDPTPIRIAIP